MSESESQALVAASTFMIVAALVGLAATVFMIIVYWKIFSKAGYSGAMSLLMLVPIANIVALCILAFGEWPIHRELHHRRQQASAYPQFPQYPVQPPY